MRKIWISCLSLCLVGLFVLSPAFAEGAANEQQMTADYTEENVTVDKEEAVSTNQYAIAETPLGEKFLIAGMIVLMVLSGLIIFMTSKRKPSLWFE